MNHEGCPAAFCSAATYSCVECLVQADCEDEVCSSGVCSACVAGQQ